MCLWALLSKKRPRTPAATAGNGVMIHGTGGKFFLLFDRSLVAFDPATGSHEKLADLPVEPRMMAACISLPVRIFGVSGLSRDFC